MAHANRMHSRAALVASSVLVFNSAASAQSRPPEPSSPPSSSLPARLGGFDEARTDVFDLIRDLRKKPPEEAGKDGRRVAFTIVPIIGAKPTTGFKAGAGANIEFALGDPTSTRISVLNGAMTISSHGQLGAGAVLLLYGRDNRWKFEGQNSFKGTRNGNVALGTGAAPGRIRSTTRSDP